MFNRYELITGPASSLQTVFSGRFLGDSSEELGVIRFDQQERGSIHLFRFQAGTWQQAFSMAIEDDLLFVDVVAGNGRDRLIAYSDGQVVALDPVAGSWQKLVALKFPYQAATGEAARLAGPGQSRVPLIDITVDLNQDDREDLVIPDFDGIWLAIQKADGAFTPPRKLGPAEPLLDATTFMGERPYRDLGISRFTVPHYLSRVHNPDFNLDGRNDLVFWDGRNFEVYLQEQDGQFSETPESMPANAPFDADGAYALQFAFSDEGNFRLLFGLRGKSRMTVLRTLRDLNGDGVSDLMTQTIEGRSILKQRSTFAVHYGVTSADRVRFPASADVILETRGRAGAMQVAGYAAQIFDDFTGNGEIDMLMRDVNVGVTGMLGAMVGKSVPINLELYRSDKGRYSERVVTRRKIRRFAPLSGFGEVFFPPVLMGDVTGDGRADLLIGQDPESLHIYPGVEGPDMLATRPLKVSIPMPADERNIWLRDLDRDGRQDVVIKLTPTGSEPTSSTRLVTLLTGKQAAAGIRSDGDDRDGRP